MYISNIKNAQELSSARKKRNKNGDGKFAIDDDGGSEDGVELSSGIANATPNYPLSSILGFNQFTESPLNNTTGFHQTENLLAKLDSFFNSIINMDEKSRLNHLQDLSQQLSNKSNQFIDDKNLQSIYQTVELRIAVELAKAKGN